MKPPSKRDIDNIRKDGFRPQVVGCFLHAHKILFVFDTKFDLWQLPQGGIDNNETIEQATIREMTEELGAGFVNHVVSQRLINDNHIQFPPHKRNARDLRTDDNRKIDMKGKVYFFVAIEVDTNQLDITKTEFDKCKWVDYEEARYLCEKIYQPGKQRVTIAALDSLRDMDLL